jgi:hypothetical protein
MHQLFPLPKARLKSQPLAVVAEQAVIVVANAVLVAVGSENEFVLNLIKKLSAFAALRV